MSHSFIQRNRSPDVPRRPGPVQLTCAWCNTRFSVSPSYVSRRKARGQVDFYCSRSCSGRSRSDSRSLNLRCDNCGSDFTRRAGVVAANLRRGSEGTYCSRTCADASKIKTYQVQDQALFDYLAGVVCGDGHVRRVVSGGGGGSLVSITVGLQDLAYMEVLTSIVESVFGSPPTVKENLKARAAYVILYGIEVADLFGPIKTSSGWNLGGIQHPGPFLAGLCDTDGCWPKKRGRDTRRAFTITQKDNGNLEKTAPLWSSLGMAPTIRHYVDKGTGYQRAVLRVGASDIERFRDMVPLRHPRKAHR